LRRESIDFKAAEIISQTFRGEPRPEPDFEIVARGLLCMARDTRPDPDAEVVTTELGEIDDVCAASDRLCRRLSDEALKGELTRSTSATLTEPSTRSRDSRIGDAEQAAPPVAKPSDATTTVNQPSGVSQPRATTPDPTRTLTLKEAAKALRVSEDTLLRMRKRNEIEMFKVASVWRVLASEVIRLRQKPKFQNR